MLSDITFKIAITTCVIALSFCPIIKPFLSDDDEPFTCVDVIGASLGILFVIGLLFISAAAIFWLWGY